MKHLALLVLVVACFGCTSIEITDKEGAVRIERSFGFASIKLPNETEAIVVKMTTLGYIASPLGYSVGYSQQMIANLNEKCRVIVWVDGRENPHELKRQIELIDSACLVEVK